MVQTVEGTVTSLLAGYYDVETDQGEVRTRARGVFRKRKEKPLVGDHVAVQLDEQGTNYLIEIFPRKNVLGRPAVANVSQVILVISAVEPDFSLELLDRYLTFFAWQQVGVTIYLSKADLVSQTKLLLIKQQLSIYPKIGYPVFTNASDLEAELPKLIKKDQIWSLAGQSGAGKSTLLNKLVVQAHQNTGIISKSLNRGKHTTRQVQLFPYETAYLADTPGFSAIDLYKIKASELRNCFYDFQAVSASCRFRTCQHLKEPACAVKAAVAAKTIAPSRYDHYVKMRQEILDKRIPDYLK